MKRCDWLLQQLGITQWKLQRPKVLQGEVTVQLPTYIRLLLVADPLPPADHRLVTDVGRSMLLTSEQIFPLTIAQILMLSDPVCCHCCWLGLKAMRNFNGICLTSPSLRVLQNDAEAKRALWRQIVDYENYHTAID